MLLRFGIKGRTPIIHHSASGIDPTSELSLEIAAIAAKRGSNRTAADDARLKELETARSLWLDHNGEPTIPASAIRAVLEAGAKKTKQGGLVREGLIVLRVEFDFDRERYGETMLDWQKTAQYSVPVVVQRNRIIRTRAKFDEWGADVIVEVDPEQVDSDQLARWLDTAGRRVGLGDWRPAKSGTFGRFALDGEIEEVGEDALD